MSAVQSNVRTFTEARDLLNLVRSARRHHLVVGLAAPAIENAGKGVQKGANLEIWITNFPTGIFCF